MASSCSLACLLLLVFSFLVLHQVPAAALQQDHQHQLSTNPVPVSAPQDATYNDKKMDCGGACAARCQSSSRPRLCKRACGTCCYRCNCVPPGTSGNYDACPCYASLITHGNRRKCP